MPSPPRRHWRWVGHAVRPVAVAAVVTVIALAGVSHRPAVRLAWAEGIDLAPGISVTPAPGWVIENQGPGWVALHNAFATAELEIRVKPANGTDAAAVLQGDIRNLSNMSTTGLTNVRDLSASSVKPLPSGNFQQQASITYSADGTSRMGAIPVLGWFMEVLNPSTRQSAFIVFAQNGDAPNRADGDAAQMVDSLQ